VTAKKLYAKIQQAPFWTRPFIGMVVFALILVGVPLWLPLFLGWIVWDAMFGSYYPRPTRKGRNQ